MYRLLLGFLLFFVTLEGVNIDEMTLEEKVGQLFMAYFDGDDANALAERLIKETKIGGIIYYHWANGLTDPASVQQLSHHLQSLAEEVIGIPLLIAADQEGGLVARLKNGFTEFPGNRALGETGDPHLAYLASFAMGQEMRAVGVNFNLAPVVDVNSNPRNPIIGIRAFGDDKETVANFGKESVRGFLDAGIIPCLKHFPGHGDVETDSHIALPILNKSLSELEDIELYPFKKLVGEAPAVMTAHLLLPQIDPKNSATLSKNILQGLLREKLGFDGVLITDSLVMQGVLEGQKSLEEVVIKAFEAGNDILLIGGRDLECRLEAEANIDEIIGLYHALLGAVREGRISESRVTESVKRILLLKKRAGLFDYSPPQDLSRVLRQKKHLELAHHIAKKALFIKEFNWDVSLTSNIITVAPEQILEVVKHSDFANFGKVVSAHEAVKEVKDATHVVFCSYNAWKDADQQRQLVEISKLKPTFCIALRDPGDLDLDQSSVAKMATFSPTRCALRAAAGWIRAKDRKVGCCVQ